MISHKIEIVYFLRQFEIFMVMETMVIVIPVMEFDICYL